MTRLGALGQLERGQRTEGNEDMKYCVIRDLPKPGWESFIGPYGGQRSRASVTVGVGWGQTVVMVSGMGPGQSLLGRNDNLLPLRTPEGQMKNLRDMR